MWVHEECEKTDTNDQRNCDRTEKSVARKANGNILFQAADLLCCNICSPSQELVSPFFSTDPMILATCLHPDASHFLESRKEFLMQIENLIFSSPLTLPLDTFCELRPASVLRSAIRSNPRKKEE